MLLDYSLTSRPIFPPSQNRTFSKNKVHETSDRSSYDSWFYSFGEEVNMIDQKTSFVAILFCLVSFALLQVVTCQLSSSTAWQLSNDTVYSINRTIEDWFKVTNEKYLNWKQSFDGSYLKILPRIQSNNQTLIHGIDEYYDKALDKFDQIDTENKVVEKKVNVTLCDDTHISMLDDAYDQAFNDTVKCLSERVEQYEEKLKAIELNGKIKDDVANDTFRSVLSNCITESDPFKIIGCSLNVREAALIVTTKSKLYIAAAGKKLTALENDWFPRCSMSEKYYTTLSSILKEYRKCIQKLIIANSTSAPAINNDRTK